jgi:hypothetical protein
MSEPMKSGPPLAPRMDRRLAIKWMLAAGAGALLADSLAFSAAAPAGPTPGQAEGYGRDADLVKEHRPGDFWPLTFSEAERRDAAALSDMVLPGDDRSPSASTLGVHDFIDEWVSAPYPTQANDRKLIVDGLGWMGTQSRKRFAAAFADATPEQRLSLCQEMAQPAPAGSGPVAPSKFFKRFLNLAMAGFYSTPVGMRDLGYVGNVPLARFEGPPADLVERLGLTDEVKW